MRTSEDTDSAHASRGTGNLAPGRRNRGWVTWLPALMPAAALLLYLSLAAHFRLAVGHWPSTLSENFSSPAFALHERFTLHLALVAFFAPLAWLAMLLFRRLRGSLKIHLLQAAAYVLGWALILLTIHYDPTFFSDWFWD